MKKNERFRTGIDYTLGESIITLKNASECLARGGKLEGECLTGLQIKNSIDNVIKFITSGKLNEINLKYLEKQIEDYVNLGNCDNELLMIFNSFALSINKVGEK